MQKIVLATNNPDKIKEFKNLFQNLPFELIPLSSYAATSHDWSQVQETGLTFIENALIKARYACKLSGFPALADDSGLVVDALNGAPGIFSARFAGVNATYAQNIAKLLQVMKNIPEEKRTASFHCVLVFLRHKYDPAPLIAHGTWEGNILFTPQGKNGFGYDSIFFVPTHNCSAAELTPTTKNQISHRAQAVQLMNKRYYAH